MNGVRQSAVIVILALAVVFGAILMSDGVPGRPVPVDRAQLLVSVMDHVEQGYIDSTGTPQLYGMALQGMLRRLGDAHAAYITPERVSLLRERAASGMSGPGLDVDERDGYITVIAPYSGTPAARAGIRTGDRVVLVNGQRTYGKSAEEVQQDLQGPPGSRVEIAVTRPGVPDQLRFSLTRELPNEDVRAAFTLTPEIGYIRLGRFSNMTPAAMTKAVDSLAALRIETLVLDLRATPGGLPEEGIAVADLFLPSGSSLATARGKSTTNAQDFIDETDARWPALELILLVDEGTANASEVAVGALQDLDRALVVGRHTFGRASRQELISLSNGGAVMLTTSRWYTPLGRRLESEVLERPRARTAQRADTAEDRPTVRTNSGRTVVGGGGIRPDVLVKKNEGVSTSQDGLPQNGDSYQKSDADEMVQRDAFVRIAVTLANQARGQSDLFVRAAAVDSAESPEG